MRTLKQRYLREQYRPGWLGMLINPFYIARSGLQQAMGELAVHCRGRLLDVGCGQKPYRDLFECEAYVGLELDTPANHQSKQADYFYDGETFPFEDVAFDSVVCNEVLEHVFNPERFLAELHRVLRPQGTLLLTVPFIWDEHEQPYDFGRYSSFGLRHLLQTHGFEVLALRKTRPGIAAVSQLFNAYLFKLCQTRNAYLNLLLTLCLMAPINLLGTLLAWLLPAGGDLYLDNVVICRRLP